MEFGVFMPNGSNGYVVSKAIGSYAPTYKHQRSIAIEAERQQFSFLLPMIKFRGFGGATGYWDECLEPFTLVGALAAEIKNLLFVPTIGMLAVHPAYTARMVSTLSNISEGRVGLNVVTGWNRPEYEQMGLWPGELYYKNRYDFATEYLNILNDLWVNGKSSRKSKFWQLEDCSCLPTPDYEIPIFSAGQSPSGIKFCEVHATNRIVFGHPQVLKKLNEDEESRIKRSYGTILLFHIITGKTDAEAFQIGQDIIRKADLEAISNQIRSASYDTNKGGTSEAHLSSLEKKLEEGNAAFNIIPVIYGTPKTVAIKINEIIDQTKPDGFMFSWNDFEIGIKTFGQEIRPLLKND